MIFIGYVYEYVMGDNPTTTFLYQMDTVRVVYVCVYVGLCQSLSVSATVAVAVAVAVAEQNI